MRSRPTGPSLASRRRGRPSGRRLADATRERALALIRERYADFGPTFAHQKLTEEHALALSVETLRGWLITAGLWVPRTQRARRSYPPRVRRACLGELVQIDGSDHAWFEDRGPRCTLLMACRRSLQRIARIRRIVGLAPHIDEMIVAGSDWKSRLVGKDVLVCKGGIDLIHGPISY